MLVHARVGKRTTKSFKGVCCGREEWEREMKETGKEENSLQAAWKCVCVCVCVHTSRRVLCGKWVGASVSRPGLSAVRSAAVLSSRLTGNIMYLLDAYRNSLVSPDWDQNRPRKRDAAKWALPETWSRISRRKEEVTDTQTEAFFEGSFHLFGLGYAMLAQRNGLPPGCKPAHLKDHPDLRDVDVKSQGCCSLSPSPSSGGCPWARLAGVDGCLSEPYCLWFQLLARAYWGEVELGLTSPNRNVSWARLREASRKNCVRSRVRSGCACAWEHPGEHLGNLRLWRVELCEFWGAGG